MAAIIIGVTAAGGYFQLRYQRRETEMLGKVSSLVLQMLTGIAKLRVAGAEMRAFAVWAEQYSVQKSNAVKAQAAAKRRRRLQLRLRRADLPGDLRHRGLLYGR